LKTINFLFLSTAEALCEGGWGKRIEVREEARLATTKHVVGVAPPDTHFQEESTFLIWRR